MNKDDRLLSKKQAAEYLNISIGTLEKLMREKELPYIKLERKVLFRKSDIDKFLEDRTIK